jgi:hypothetical protein
MLLVQKLKMCNRSVNDCGLFMLHTTAGNAVVVVKSRWKMSTVSRSEKKLRINLDERSPHLLFRRYRREEFTLRINIRILN